MKVALILAFIGLAYADYVVRNAEDLAVFRKECAAELNIPAEKVENFKQWKFENDEITQKYIHCVFKKFPIYEDGKGILLDNLVTQLASGSDKTREELTNEVNTCIQKHEADINESEYCFKQFACFKQGHLQLIRASVKKD